MGPVATGLGGRSQALRILIVDDDAFFSRYLQLALEAEKVHCTCAQDGDAALTNLNGSAPGTFDLVLLDIDMPGMSGWELLYQLRVAGNEIPVIFVSGHHRESEEKVKGLELGADDYVVKPFKTEELVARMKAVLRRRETLGILVFADLTIDLARRHVTRDSVDVGLTPREFDLLYALVHAKGALVQREELLHRVWGFDFDPGTNVLDVHIGRLRKKLDKLGPPLIMNVRGEGYRLEIEPANQRT
jgi:two-component system copper resistance phosphate regulon response regulator CusR